MREGSLVTFESRYDHWIGGEYVKPARGQYFDNPSPVTGQTFCEIARGTAEDVEARALIQQGHYGTFMEAATERVRAIRQGHPLDTDTMIGAGVWTRDSNTAYRAGRAIQAGRVWTNCYHAYPAPAPACSPPRSCRPSASRPPSAAGGRSRCGAHGSTRSPPRGA
jgi:acyl-CoA reductase-like NAD-dependent aldehyde dehydrogenase